MSSYNHDYLNLYPGAGLAMHLACTNTVHGASFVEPETWILLCFLGFCLVLSLVSSVLSADPRCCTSSPGGNRLTIYRQLQMCGKPTFGLPALVIVLTVFATALYVLLQS